MSKCILKAGNRVIVHFQSGCDYQHFIGHIDAIGERDEITVRMEFCDRFLNPGDLFGGNASSPLENTNLDVGIFEHSSEQI